MGECDQCGPVREAPSSCHFCLDASLRPCSEVVMFPWYSIVFSSHAHRCRWLLQASVDGAECPRAGGTVSKTFRPVEEP